MKFICPRCQARLTIPAERVPAQGAWARCPKCRERFFLKVRAPEEFAEAPALRRRGRTAEEQALIDRQRAKTGRPETSLEGAGGGWEVVVFPQPAADYRLYGLIAALAVGGFLGFLVHGFRSAGDWPTRTEAQAPRAALAYEEAGLAADLSAMRLNFSRRSGLNRTIDYQCPEVRVFKHLMTQLAPEACGGELAQIRLWSSNTLEGFRVVGFCLAEAKGTTPEVEVRWAEGAALAGLANDPGRLEIPLASEAEREASL